MRKFILIFIISILITFFMVKDKQITNLYGADTTVTILELDELLILDINDYFVIVDTSANITKRISANNVVVVFLKGKTIDSLYVEKIYIDSMYGYDSPITVLDTMNITGQVYATYLKGDSTYTPIIVLDTIKSNAEITGYFNLTKDSLQIAGTSVTTTAAELNKLDGCNATTEQLNYLYLSGAKGASEASKALILDASKQIDSLNTTGDIISGNDVILSATGKVLLDGAGGHTYIEQTTDDVTGVFVGGTKMMEFIEDTADTLKITARVEITGTADITSDFTAGTIESDAGVTATTTVQGEQITSTDDAEINDSLYVGGKTICDSTISIGSWGYTGEHIIIPETSSNTNAGIGGYFEVPNSISAGKVIAGEYTRLVARNTNQTNQSTLVGTESQFRLRDVDIADGVHAGLWAYAEQSGTSTLSGGGTFDAISATVESEAGFTTGATEHVTGLTLDSSINAGATINASTNFSAIYIKSNGKDWFNGIKITGVANDILLRNGATIDNTSTDLLTITEPTVDIVGNLTANTITTDADNFVTSDLIVKTYKDNDIDSLDTINLPDGAIGHGVVFISNDTNEEGGTFGFYDDNPCLISVSTNTQEADATGKLVIMDGGDTVTIKNRLGNNHKLTMTIFYYIP